MSEESVETPIDQTVITGISRLNRKPNLLPWVLFGVTGGILAALTIVLVRQVSIERRRADNEAQEHANQVARAEKAEQNLTLARADLAQLKSNFETLSEEREALAVKVKMLEDSKVARVDPLPPRPPPKPPVKKAKKKVTKKKKR